MFKLVLKYAAAVTAAKVGGAQTAAEMIATAKATLTQEERDTLLKWGFPDRCAEVEAAAWAGKTFRQQFPEAVGGKALLDKFDAALTPVEN